MCMYHCTEISSNYHWTVCFSYCLLRHCAALDGCWLPKTKKQFRLMEKADYDLQFKEIGFLSNCVVMNLATSIAS